MIIGTIVVSLNSGIALIMEWKISETKKIHDLDPAISEKKKKEK